MMKQNCCILYIINRLWQLCTAQSYNMAEQSPDKPLLIYAYMNCSNCVCVCCIVCICEWVLELANYNKTVRTAIWSIPLGKHVLGTTDSNKNIES